jgi:hypothetical protein
MIGEFPQKHFEYKVFSGRPSRQFERAQNTSNTKRFQDAPEARRAAAGL